MQESEIGWSRAKDLVRKLYLQTDDSPERQFYRQVLDVLRMERVESISCSPFRREKERSCAMRAYADDGQGFTVAFDTSKITDIAHKSSDSFGFGKISYSASEFDKKVRAGVQKYWNVVSKHRMTGSDRNLLTEEAAIYLDAAIGSFAVTYKHSSRSEFEWRINTFVAQGDPKNEVIVRSNGRRLIPYVPLRLCGAEEECLPITRIGIGPGFRDSGVRYAVEKLCQQTGVDAQIYNADTPFRRV